MDHTTLAGAPRIVEPAGNGATDFVNKLFDSGSVVPSICMFLGGAAIVTCVSSSKRKAPSAGALRPSCWASYSWHPSRSFRSS